MITNQLNWNDLRYFLELARRGRLHSVASRLGVTHTTVSRRVAVLENALETKLFVQNASGFKLTEHGEKLLPLALKIENTTDLARENIQSSRQSLSGSIRIGAPDGFGNAFFAGKIVTFCKTNPDLTIELIPIPLNHNLTKREVDMVISLEPSKQPGIFCRKITDYALFLFTTQAYIDDNNIDKRNHEELYGHILTDYIPDILYSQELKFNALLGKNISSRFQSSTVIAQYQHIVNGGGLGFLPYFMAHEDPRLVHIAPQRFHFSRSYWLLIPEELRKRASIRGLEKEIFTTTQKAHSSFLPDIECLRKRSERLPD